MVRRSGVKDKPKKTFGNGHVLSWHDLQKSVSIETWYVFKDDGRLYILVIDKIRYLVSRTGVCEPKRCKSACCKVISINVGGARHDGESHENYWTGFADEMIGCHAIIKKRCRGLRSDGSCSVWKKKSFPGPCKEFPHPNDGVYLSVEPVCSFKFVVMGVLS